MEGEQEILSTELQKRVFPVRSRRAPEKFEESPFSILPLSIEHSKKKRKSEPEPSKKKKKQAKEKVVEPQVPATMAQEIALLCHQCKIGIHVVYSNCSRQT